MIYSIYKSQSNFIIIIMEFAFQKEMPDASKRKIESNKIREKHPDRVPTICEKKDTDKIDQLDKTRFLVPMDQTLTQFSSNIRKRINLDKSKALNLLIQGTDKKQFAESGEKLMSELYEKYKNPDGFLYIIYTGEITWG